MSKTSEKSFLLIFLGTLSAFGPFVMDMYLPTLPAMSDFFHTSSPMVQLGLTAGMTGLAAGQLIFGPLSDRYGRRRPLIAAMILFLVSTLGCILSREIIPFIALRFIQGVAGAGGVVLSRSIAADKYSSHELAAMLALIGAVNGIATVAAPIAGGILAGSGGWHRIFVFLFLLGTVLLAGSLRLHESLPKASRQAGHSAGVAEGFKAVFHNRPYICYVLQYGFTMSVLFANISSAPFIMQEHFGLSPFSFSVCFGTNAIAMIIFSTLAVKLPSMERALQTGSHGMLLFSAMLAVALPLECSFWIYEILIFGLLSMIGMSFTASNALAMNCERHHAGIAFALLGAAGYAFGGIVSPLAGIGNILCSTGILFLTGSVCAYICTRHAVSRALSPAL